MSSDEYPEFMTLLQFYTDLVKQVELRKKKIEESIQDFFAEGGDITREGNLVTISCEDPDTGDTLTYKITYASNGDVEEISYKPKRNPVLVEKMQRMIFCITLLPFYEDMIGTFNTNLSNLKNDNVLNGLAEVRNMIRGDQYLTVGAIGGVDISRIADSDPFGIFEEGGTPE